MLFRSVKNVGTVEDERKDDTVNVPVNDTVKLPQLTERQHIAKIRGVQDILRILPYRVVQPMFPLVTPTELLGLFLAAAPDAALPVPSVYFYFHLFTPYSLPMQFITN